jgi:hypothetical protein
MAGRFWGLSRRQTIVTLSLAALVGVLLVFVLPRADDSGSDRASPHALWAFGFSTVRVDPKTMRPSSRPLPRGFGSVLSTPGKVYLFEPADGRIGMLDASRNTLKVIARLAPGVGPPAGVDPLIAHSGRRLWLVTNPGTIVRFELKSHRATTIDLGVASQASPPTTTRVITSGDAVIAVSETPSGYALSRLDAGRQTEPRTQVLRGEGTIVGLTADARSVWILTRTAALRVDSNTLQIASRVAIPPTTQGVPRGAAIAHGGLWTLGENGSQLLRIDAASRQTTTALQLLALAPPALRAPASVLAGDGNIWAMVQRTVDPSDHSVRVGAVNAKTGKPTKAVDFPTELFIGAIAVT